MSEATVIFRTRARAELDRLAIDPGVALLGELRPEEEPAMAVGFLSLAAAGLFVRELAIGDVRLLAAPFEDADALLAVIRGDPAAAVH